MLRWIVGAALALALGHQLGCETSGKAKPTDEAGDTAATAAERDPAKQPEPAKGPDPVADMAEMVRHVCACTDVACVEAVQKKTTALGAKYREAKMTPEQAKKLGDLARKFTECSMKYPPAKP